MEARKVNEDVLQRTDSARCDFLSSMSWVWLNRCGMKKAGLNSPALPFILRLELALTGNRLVTEGWL